MTTSSSSAATRTQKQPQCTVGTIFTFARARAGAADDEDAFDFDEAWYKYARARVYYDALGREKNMVLTKDAPTPNGSSLLRASRVSRARSLVSLSRVGDGPSHASRRRATRRYTLRCRD